MKPKKTKDIIRALTKKGFHLRKLKHRHIRYEHKVNGKRTGIFTFLSHGEKEYDKHLLGAMRKEMKFDNDSDMERYIDCDMSEEEYTNYLLARDHIKS